MIEIIKKGVIKHKLSCGECNCEFRYTADELTEEMVWDDHGGHYPAAVFLYINCPFCNHTIYVDDRKFTTEELNMVKKEED